MPIGQPQAAFPTDGLGLSQIAWKMSIMGAMRKSRLSHDKQNRLTEHLVSGSTASSCGANRKTAALFFLRLREISALELETESEAVFDGEIKVDENYFGGRRGRGPAGKVPVFGVLNRGAKVFARIISGASGATLIPLIKREVIPDCINYSDCWKGDNVLDVSDLHHIRINHSKLFTDRRNHINGPEDLRNQAKRHMRKFNGVPNA